VGRVSTVWTLTMNPALDVSTDTATVVAGEKIRCGPTVLDPGGGGVNVSRVLHRLGHNTRAVFVAGGLTGDLYSTLLDGEGVLALPVGIRGETRESFTVTETDTGAQYRFVLQGPVLDKTEVARVVDTLDGAIRPGDWLVASGSLPPGVPDDYYGQLATRCHATGLTVIVDTAPPWLAPAIAGGVFLVKPSRHELEEYVGRELTDRSSQLVAAREMAQRSGAEIIALSLGQEGALLVTRDAAWHAVAPGIVPVSTVGAGDSFVAGIVGALHAGHSPDRALAWGVAAGSATAQSPATTLCNRGDVERIVNDVVTTTMGK